MASRRYNTSESSNDRRSLGYYSDNLAYAQEYVPYEPYAPRREIPNIRPQRDDTPLREVPTQDRRRSREILKREMKRENLVMMNAIAKRGIVFVIFAGIVMLAIVLLSAKASKLQYDINTLEDQLVVLQNDVNLLNVTIESANTLDKTEKHAIEALGLKYPAAAEFVRMDTDQASAEGQTSLKDMIMAKIYGE